MDEGYQKLFELAQKARENAIAPYSHYKVGAVLVTKNGDIIPGCNVEYPSNGLTICAERCCLSAAIAQGHKEFAKVFVVTKDGGSPCGMCRQVIYDRCGDIPVIVSDQDGNCKEYSSAELLPFPHGAENLKA